MGPLRRTRLLLSAILINFDLHRRFFIGVWKANTAVKCSSLLAGSVNYKIHISTLATSLKDLLGRGIPIFNFGKGLGEPHHP